MRTTLLATSIGTTRLTVSEAGTRLLLACGLMRQTFCLTRRLVVQKCPSRPHTHTSASLTSHGLLTLTLSMKCGTQTIQTISDATAGTTLSSASGSTLSVMNSTFLVTSEFNSATRFTASR